MIRFFCCLIFVILMISTISLEISDMTQNTHLMDKTLFAVLVGLMAFVLWFATE